MRLFNEFWKTKETTPADEREGYLGLPVIWLLGKTGAGKSSLIRALTGLTDLEIGGGFKPCTRTTRSFGFPLENPMMHFLDTRGLGEVAYDPAEDLRNCENISHVLLVVVRMDDQVQGEVADALRRITKTNPSMPIMLVWTGSDLIPEHEQGAVREHLRRALQMRECQETVLSLGPNIKADALVPIHDFLADALPEVAFLLQRNGETSDEAKRFAVVRPRVLQWAAGAAASDMFPATAIVTVPGAQLTMLVNLARLYGCKGNIKEIFQFLALLGGGMSLRYGLSFAAKQAGKLVPVYGQTAGTAVAAASSFAATYALARVACRYFYDLSQGRKTRKEEMSALYRQAFRGAQEARDA
ncbi:GTP-binding DUF697 domain-containing protein [Sedimentimonas flavescens]|uniref:GTP-binding DUF697 domain-containing protein n=1 Tax=Sedimentimonas flavescens TaxID=2851012 RepID=UPI0021A3C409|nr:GTP-binding DUF697 domain-containing protein [Sedimentimonas flavescens]MCT2539964.1 GTP-binding DUF697 domain-containing protein [Sedimentimonas flavescens]